MKVLVSGSSGLIGSALVAALTEAGHDVVRLVRPGSATVGAPAPPPTAGRVAWDPAAGRLDLGALAGTDAIINLAGAGIGDHRWSEAYRAELGRSRLDATRLLAHAAAVLEPRPQALLSASAVGYYGDRGDELLTEASPSGGGFLADLCRRWEEATSEAGDAGVRVAHLRSGVVLAKRGGALAKQLPLFRFGLGGRLGRGRQWLSWITLDDEVRAIAHVLGTPLVGAVNLTAPSPVTNAEFTRVLAAALHRPAVLAVPRFALGLALGSQMADEMILAGQRALPAALEASGFAFTDREVAGALARILS